MGEVAVIAGRQYPGVAACVHRVGPVAPGRSRCSVVYERRLSEARAVAEQQQRHVERMEDPCVEARYARAAALLSRQGKPWSLAWARLLPSSVWAAASRCVSS